MNITLRTFLQVFHKTFDKIDKILEGHGVEVAYLMWKVLEEIGTYKEDEIIDICTISLIHDIGAYKTERGKALNSFELKSPNNHAIYGYLFIKEFSPLTHLAEIVLYHHIKNKYLNEINSQYCYEAALLNLIDYIDIFFRNSRNFDLDKVYYLSNNDFLKKHVDILKRIDEKEEIFSKIRSGKYYDDIMKFFEKKILTEEEMISYAKMFTYAIDFSSEHTVYHTIAVESLSEIIAEKLNLQKDEIEVVKTASLLHDIGKISTPLDILEKPGRLTDEEMEIMKKHVEVTYDILSEIGLDKYRDIAAFHHEKLDGSGYPFGLKGDKLSVSARIVAIADIITALLGRRSYKEPFSKDDIIKILIDMSGTKIDSDIVNIVIDNYDDMINTLYENCKEVFNQYSSINKNYEHIQRIFFDKYK